MAFFRSRSPDRDKLTDRNNIVPIAKAIDGALAAATSEVAGLSKRLENATTRAALLAGNDSEEYLSRDPTDARRLEGYESEMQRASARIAELNQLIAHLKFLRSAFSTRFSRYLDA